MKTLIVTARKSETTRYWRNVSKSPIPKKNNAWLDWVVVRIGYGPNVTRFSKVTNMTLYLNLGMPVSLDDACDTRMTDGYEFTLYQSDVDEDDESHAIVLTLWSKGARVAHNFAYTANYDGTQETRESGDDPSVLVDDLPEAYRDAAQEAVDRWCGTFLSDGREMYS